MYNMSMPKKSAINVRLDKTQKDAIKKMSKACSMSMSAFLWYLVVKEKDNHGRHK